MRPSHRKHNRMWPRMRDTVEPTTVSMTEILKDLYPSPGYEMKRPEVYVIAKKFGWITSAEYWAQSPVPTGKYVGGFDPDLYGLFPLMKLTKKPTWQPTWSKT